MDLPKCFVKASKDNTELLARHSEILVMSVFSKQRMPTPDSSRLIALTEKFLVYYKDSTKTKVKRICQLTFDCRFQILREVSQTTRTIGTPVGIRFEKTGHTPIELFSSSVAALQMWKEQLEKVINQRGFHSLFKPIKKIGKGNFASVYLAERLEDRKLVAVKAFSKESLYGQEKGRDSLINQIKLLRRLDQNNIMKLLCVYQSDNSIYMTLQLLQGGQLFTKIQSKHVFTTQQVRQIMRGLLNGLQHMHSKRIMHRDLKPQNIMLRRNDSCEPVIADFGLATWADEQEYLFVRCGTPGYVAPEIINIRDMKTKSEPICDVFSVGLIFHILLLGRSVFPGKTYNDVLVQNRACDFYLDSPQYIALGRPTHQLLKAMLQKTPSKRISASQALRHPYFSQMEIQKPSENAFYNETPILKVMDENTRPSDFPWGNKVSIFSPREDSVLKNISNQPTKIAGLKYPGNNFGYYGQHHRQYSNQVVHRQKMS